MTAAAIIMTRIIIIHPYNRHGDRAVTVGLEWFFQVLRLAKLCKVHWQVPNFKLEMTESVTRKPCQ